MVSSQTLLFVGVGTAALYVWSRSRAERVEQQRRIAAVAAAEQRSGSPDPLKQEFMQGVRYQRQNAIVKLAEAVEARAFAGASVASSPTGSGVFGHGWRGISTHHNRLGRVALYR